MEQFEASEYLRVSQRTSITDFATINHGTVAGDVVESMILAGPIGNEYHSGTVERSDKITSRTFAAVRNIPDIGQETHNILQKQK